jgi:hypothetical protein
MANRETAVSEADLAKIVRLLRTHELTIPEIARRTRYSRAIIASIKRRMDVRKVREPRSVN